MQNPLSFLFQVLLRHIGDSIDHLELNTFGDVSFHHELVERSDEGVVDLHLFVVMLMLYFLLVLFFFFIASVLKDFLVVFYLLRILCLLLNLLIRLGLLRLLGRHFDQPPALFAQIGGQSLARLDHFIVS